MKHCGQEKLYSLGIINDISSGFGNFIKDQTQYFIRYLDTEKFFQKLILDQFGVVNNSTIELN